MRLAFVTMVWRDHWLLEKWLQHNSQYVDRSALYVINHGGDPEIHKIAEGCNVIDIPREEVTIDLTRRRWDLLGGLTNGLLGFYDRVICTDVDELILYVGDKPSLQDHLAASTAETEALSPVGLNLIPTGEGDVTQGVLAVHHDAMLSAKYTKPCILREKARYTVGGHGLQGGAFTIDPDLLLLHLHYVTPDYAARMAERKEIVQQSRAHNDAQDKPLDLGGRYWINWAKADTIREKEFALFEKAQVLPVDEGFDRAAELLREAVRVNGRKMVVDHTERKKDPYKIRLPEALRDRL